MPIQGTDLFKFVDLCIKNCLRQKLDECVYRTAISRIYYGIFHYVQSHYGIQYPEPDGCHKYICNQGLHYGYYQPYLDLLGLRKNADYDLSMKIGKEEYNKAEILHHEILRGEFHIDYDEEKIAQEYDEK